jgi:hypothetical protein
MVCIWQHDKRTDDYKIMLNFVRSINEKKEGEHSSKKVQWVSRCPKGRGKLLENIGKKFKI